MEVDVATITLVRVGDKITLLSKGDGALGELADGLVKVCGEVLDGTGNWEVDPFVTTRDPYAGTNEEPTP